MPRTLPEALGRQAPKAGISRGIRLLDERGRASFLAYSDLVREAAAVGRALDRAGIRSQDRVMILLPTCRTLVTMVVGCLLKGILPMPGDPGGAWRRRQEAPLDTLALARSAGVHAIIAAARRVGPLCEQLGSESVRVLAAESLRHAPAIGAEEIRFNARPEDPAVITCTYGATAARRPVLLTHGNIASHLNALGRALRTGERELLCGFAGLDTGPGLIDLFLFGLFHGFDQVLLAPDWVYTQPTRWIWAISSFRCTLTMAETTAYGHCAHKLADEDLRDLDLSCLRRALTFGSPLRPGTQEAFIRRFTPHGLPLNVFLPAYSRTEACGILCSGRPGGHTLSDRFDRRSLRPERFVHTAGIGDSRGRLMMSSGMPLAGLEIRILGTRGQEMEEGQVGRITVRGTAVTPGMDGGMEPDAEGWIETWDLGFFMQGELFVIGSVGDGLELNGFRYDPEELEAVAAEVPGIRQGGVAAFTVSEEEQERPVVIAAAARGLGPLRRGILADRLGVRIGRMIGLRPEVLLVPTRSLSRWGRGRSHRETCRERYLESWSEGNALLIEEAPEDVQSSASPERDGPDAEAREAHRQGG